MTTIEVLSETINTHFGDRIEKSVVAYDELTLILRPEHLLQVAAALKNEPQFDFKLLIDVCGVDYLKYGIAEWETEKASSRGFERGVIENTGHYEGKRFASIYHLLSLTHNQRVRLKVLLDEASPVLPSVVDIWPAANWFEREAFDLYGIIYEGHPDLRRILTDYGFVGHPFRKDFPLSGHVEARYDAAQQRVIYEPVSIEPRILEPKVIRKDPRYEVGN